MINIYNLYSTNILNGKFAIWKLVLRAEFYSSFIGKKVIFENQFSTIVNILSRKDNNKSGNFLSIDEYKRFLQSELEDINADPPDQSFFSGYATNISELELNFFIHNINKQSGYLFPKVYDAKNKIELPAFYVVFVDYLYSIEEPFKRLTYPNNEDEKISLLYENQFHRLVNMYEKDNILNFDYPYNLLYEDIQNLVVKYLTHNELNIKTFNKVLNELIEIQNIGVRNYLEYILFTFSKFLEEEHQAIFCRNCGQLFNYSSKKRYCSERCKTTAKNKRYYRRKKLNKQ